MARRPPKRKVKAPIAVRAMETPAPLAGVSGEASPDDDDDDEGPEGPDEFVRRDPEGSGATRGDQKERLSLPLTPEGTFDLEGMRDTSAAKLRAAVAGDPDFMARLGLAGSAKGHAAISDSMAGHLFGLLGGLEAHLATLVGVPADEAVRIFTFTPQETESVGPALAAVINKHTSGLGKYQEELTLLLVMAAVHQPRIVAALAARRPAPKPALVAQLRPEASLRDIVERG